MKQPSDSGWAHWAVAVCNGASLLPYTGDFPSSSSLVYSSSPPLLSYSFSKTGRHNVEALIASKLDAASLMHMHVRSLMYGSRTQPTAFCSIHRCGAPSATLTAHHALRPRLPLAQLSHNLVKARPFPPISAPAIMDHLSEHPFRFCRNLQAAIWHQSATKA